MQSAPGPVGFLEHRELMTVHSASGLMTVHSASGFRAHRGEVLDGGELASSVRLGQRPLHAPHLRGPGLHGQQAGFSHSFTHSFNHRNPFKHLFVMHLFHPLCF